MEGRRIVSDMTSLETCGSGASRAGTTRSSADIDMVYDYFPRLKERGRPRRYLSGGEQQMLRSGER